MWKRVSNCILTMLLTFIIMFVMAGCGDIALFFGGKIPEGVTIAGVSVGGLKIEEAEKKIDEIREALRQQAQFTFKFNGEETALPKEYIAVTVNPGKIFEEIVRKNQKNINYDIDYSLDISTAEKFIQKLASSYNTQPIDATVSVKANIPEKFVYSEPTTGIDVDYEAAYKALLEKAANKDFSGIDLTYKDVPPLITIQTLKDNTRLVSSFKTEFKRPILGYANRVFNIAKAASLINGTEVKPGEIFDANKIIGPRTYELGWRSAGAIVHGAMVHEAGGGVCQVSTTIYNAVLLADLEVVERRNHSIPSLYVPLGRDATIYTGATDFRFKNNKDTPVYVFANADTKNKTLTIQIYGKPLPEGYEIKLSSKQTGTFGSKDRTEYVLDSSVPIGSQVVEREARIGKRAVTYVDHYQDGQLIKREEILSIYDACSARIHINPADTVWMPEDTIYSGPGDDPMPEDAADPY